MGGGGYFEDEALERGWAVVAQDDGGTNGDSGGGGDEVDVEVVGGEGEGGAFGVSYGVGLGRGWLSFDCSRVGWGGGVAGEENFAGWRGGLALVGFGGRLLGQS